MAKKKTRRKWTDDQKRQILKRIDSVKAKGGKVGEFLKSQGLFSSMVAVWRKDLGAPSKAAKATTKPKAKAKRTTQPQSNGGALVALAQENEALRLALTTVRGQLAEVCHA